MSQGKDKSEFWSSAIGGLSLQETLIVKESASVEDAILLMQNEHRGCVCVEDDQSQICGIFTERDVLRKYVDQSIQPSTPVTALMTRDPIMIDKDTSLSDAVELFHEYGFHHLPVKADNESLLGLLSVRVVIAFVAENLSEEVLNLPPDRTIISMEEDGG